MKEHASIGQKTWFLYATEFLSGMSVMAVELGASRLLAPYFSSSQIVWTMIIGTIMIAMALGSVWGGRSADRNPDPARLYRRLLLAAVWIAAIPLVGRYVIAGISVLLALFVTKNYLIWAAFASCMVLFVFPLMLLGTVTPCLVKYTVSSLECSGSTVGRLSAFNTIGSILGTFLPTFVTIPAAGTAATFLMFAAVLMLLSLFYFLKTPKRLISCVVCLVFTGVSALLCQNDSFAFWEDDVVLEDESIYNYIQVQETDSAVILSTNVLFGVQSIAPKQSGLTGMYYDYALAAPCMTEQDCDRILILGLGTGTYATQCLRYFPSSTVEGVEIDEKIADLAKSRFSMPDAVDVTVGDGRSFLDSNPQEQYDVILVDAYQDITIPFQMSSVEFFETVRGHLKEGGVMVVNLNMNSDAEGSINACLCDTIASVFRQVYTVKVQGGTNRVLFAGDLETALPQCLEQGVSAADDEALAELMNRVAEELEPWTSGGHLLTDDCAPVEVLGMKVLDTIVADELSYYRGVYENEGLSGLLSQLLG